jgi:hypothetical protein
MPAGVTWPTYLKLASAAMLSMFAGAQVVHMFYKPLEVRMQHFIWRDGVIKNAVSVHTVSVMGSRVQLNQLW